jgi:hypothetical protein
MIQGYIRPQLLIREVLQQLPNVDALSLHAFVVGPQFDLFRYYVPAERANMTGAAFAYNSNTNPTAQQIVPFEGLKPYHTVDSSFVKLYAENLEGQSWIAASPPDGVNTADPSNPFSFRLPSLSSPNKILVTLRGANITVTPGTATAPNGLDKQMATVTVNYGGAGYPVNTTFTTPVLNATLGSGAVVQLTTNASGVVTSGVAISPGFGYRAAATFDVPGASAGTNVGTDDATLIPQLQGRPIQPGDICYTTDPFGHTIRRVVQSVQQQNQPATIGAGNNGQFVAAVTNPGETDAFSFANTSAPFDWNINLAKTSLLAVTVTAAGSGYVTAPVVTIPAPTVVNPVTTDNTNAGIAPWAAVQAAATAILSGATVGSVQVTEPGTGYFTGGVTAITVGTRGTSGMYSVANPPIVSIAAPNDTVNGVQATAVAIISPGGGSLPLAGELLAIAVINPGAGYSAPPTVTINGGTATATATVTAAPSITVAGTATVAPVIQSLPSNWNGLVQGSTYQGKYGERYTLTCTQSGTTNALFRVRSSSGGFTADNVVPTVRGNYFYITDASLGGLAVELNAIGGQGLNLGDQFSFVVLGKYLPLIVAPSGQVVTVNIISAGSGYSAGSLTFTAPPAGGRIAAGKYTISAGAIATIVITDPGAGYIYPPVVTASVGTGAMLQAVIGTPQNSCDIAVVAGSTYNGPVNNRYVVTVTQGDTTGGQNSFANAVVRVQDTAGIDAIKSITVQQGVNYNLGSYGLQFIFPNNQVSPSGLSPGTTATATLTQVGGVITAVTVTNPGIGYVVPPVITITTSGGTNAVLEPILNNGTIESILVISGGSGYSGADTLAVAAPTTYQQGLRTGDTYYIDVTAPTAGGAYNTVLLNGPAVDITGWAPTDVLVNLLNVEFRVPYTGAIAQQLDPADAPNLAWTVGASGISVKSYLKIYAPDRNVGYQYLVCQNAPYARLYASWRGLVPSTGTFAANGSVTRYSSSAAIIAAFGANDMDNPVSYAANIAFNGSQGKSIFVSSVATNDLAGYSAILQQASRVQGPYALVPTTTDPAIVALFKTHVDSCSEYNIRLWRRVYIGTTSPGKYAVYQADSNGNSLQAQVLTNGTGNVRVVAPLAKFITEEVQPGDLFRTYFVQDVWGNSAYQEFPILSVLENNELILSSGPAVPISPAIRFEIWRSDTSNSQCVYVGNISEGLDDRRVVNVWIDNPTVLNSAGQYVVTPIWNVAAEIAGLRSALLPQQGLTYTQLQYSVTAAPTMYTKYLDSDLDLAASNGVLIATQETVGGPVFIRHQLTTDSNDGSLYYEDSVGTNIDNIAYTIKTVFQPYIGQRNATPAVVEELDVRLRNILNGFKGRPANLSIVGPAIIDYSNLTVQIDPNFRDRINVQVTVQIPLPLNVIDITLTATTIQGDVSITTTISTPTVST